MPCEFHQFPTLQELAKRYQFSAAIILPRLITYPFNGQKMSYQINLNAIVSTLSTDQTSQLLGNLRQLPEPLKKHFSQSFDSFSPFQRWMICEGGNSAISTLIDLIPPDIGQSFIISRVVMGADWEQSILFFSHEHQTDLYSRFQSPSCSAALNSLSIDVQTIIKNLQSQYGFQLNFYTAFCRVSLRECLCVCRLAQGVPEDVVCNELGVKNTRYLVDNFKVKLGLPCKADALRFVIRQGLVV